MLISIYIDNGRCFCSCPLKSTNAFFEYHGEEDIVHHYKKVAFVINLLDLAGSDDKYAYVLFNISLCKDFGADYPHLPAVD